MNEVEHNYGGSPAEKGSGGLFSNQPDFGVHEELAMYRELFATLPIAAYIKDLDARFVDVNPFHAEALGVGRADIAGLADADLYPEKEAELYRTADRSVMDAGASIAGLTETHTGFNDTVVQHRTWKFPVRDRLGNVVGLMGFSHDVSESSAAMEELKRSELRYALALQASRDGIWEFDVAAETVLMSPRAAQLMGLPISVEPAPWSVVSEALGEEDSARLREQLVALFTNPRETVELQVQVETGDHPRFLELRFTAFRERGRITSLIGSVADVTYAYHRLAQLDFYAHHDALTGLGNRRALARKLSAAISQLQRCPGSDGKTELSLLVIDLDSFKVINDSLGHLAGDAMLKIVANRLQRFANELPGTSMVTRYGGDEFAIVVEESSMREVETFAHGLIGQLKEPTMLHGLEVYPSASIGVLHVCEHVDATDVLRDADIALYRAKSTGKSRATIFHTGMRDDAQTALDEQTRIRRAVDNGDFALFYQPVLSPRSNTVIGFEALLRLKGSDGSMVRPALFLDYLERSDLIVEVGRWVVDQAVQDLAQWRADYPEYVDLAVAVNVSRRQFADDELFTAIPEVLDRYDVPASALVLEITETAVADGGVDLDALQGFRASGGLVAIDDFGTGHSSLFALNELPVDIVKLDRSFTARIGPNGADEMLEATFDFLRSLNVQLVAEGVEEQYQADWLSKRGSDFLQGYHFAKPMPEADVRKYLDVASYQALPDAA